MKYLNVKIILFIFTMLLLSGFVVPAKADAAGWMAGFGYRKKITVSKTNVSSTLSYFPLLVKFAETGGGVNNIGSHAATTGYDIMFTDSDGTTLLPYERETFSISGNNLTANIWVRVPSLTAASGATIYVYYGNPNQATDWTAATSTIADCTSITNAQCTWKEGSTQNFAAVYHMKETGTNPTVGDSTANAYNSTSQTWTPTVSAKIGAGAGLASASSQYLDFSNYADNLSIFSVSQWVYTNTARNTFLMKMSNYMTSGGWITYSDSSGRFGLSVSKDNSNYYDKYTNTAIGTGAWHYLVATFSSGTTHLYVDGTEPAATSGPAGTVTSFSNSVNVQFGKSITGRTVYANGVFDEARVSSGVRSADWVKFEYYNQSSATNELSVGGQEALSIPFLSGWAYRKKITIPKTNVGSDLTNFPFYARINADSAIGAKALVTGFDVRFTSADGTTLLAYERESWTGGGGGGGTATANFWVKVPTISSTAGTDIYIYYGNASATTDWTAATSTLTNCTAITNAQCTWKEGANQNYKGVYHLKETGTNPTVNDSTSNANNSTAQTWTPTTGKVNGGANFVGGAITLPNNFTTLDSGNTWTISTWFKSDTYTTYGGIVQVDNGAGLSQTSNTKFGMLRSINNVAVRQRSSTSISNNWMYVVGVANGADNGNMVIPDPNSTIYVNGMADNGSFQSDASYGSRNKIGSGYANTNGSIDEVRISSTARSADWTKFEYCNMVASDATTCGGTNNYEQSYAGQEFLSANASKISVKSSQDTGTSWLAGWGYRKKITIYKKNVASSLSNFPLYVRINADSKMTTALATGYDVRFTTSDGTTLLAYEQESWTGGGGSSATANFWVKVPTISNSADTSIYIYYGNASANTDWTAATSTLTNCTTITNAQCVWKEGSSQNFASVYHLKETGTNPTVNDSTSNANNSSAQVWTPTAGQKIGGAGTFDGSSTYINTTNNADNLANMTVGFWFNTTQVQSGFRRIFIGKITQGSNGAGWWVQQRALGEPYANAMDFGTQVAGGSAWEQYCTTTAFNDGNWHYFSWTLSGGPSSSATFVAYVDGISRTLSNRSSGSFSNYSATTNVIFGRDGNSNALSFYNGKMDETRVASTTRSADWIKFEYCNMMSTAGGTCTGTNETGFGGQEASASNILREKTGKATIKIK